MSVKQTINLRKVMLINPRFQLFFLGFMVVVAALVLGVIYGANAYFFWKFQRYGEAMHLSSDHMFFSFLNQQRTLMNQVFAVTAVVISAMAGILGLVISHRIAGPLYRLTKHLKEAAMTGTYRPVKFREGDFFPEVAEAYNAQIPKDSSKTHAA
jgi:hypothetical protein